MTAAWRSGGVSKYQSRAASEFLVGRKKNPRRSVGGDKWTVKNMWCKNPSQILTTRAVFFYHFTPRLDATAFVTQNLIDSQRCDADAVAFRW